MVAENPVEPVKAVRDALTGPPLARLTLREKTHALRAALSAAVTIGDEHGAVRAHGQARRALQLQAVAGICCHHQLGIGLPGQGALAGYLLLAHGILPRAV